ncbi:MAG: SprT family zinc-dependent metalloprotease [Desulfuromonadaceae bacterium]
MAHIRSEYRNHEGLKIEVIRSRRRKSAEIRVAEGTVSIRVPMHTSVDQIDAFLHARRDWILKKVALQAQMSPAKPRAYVSGELFSYLGSNYRLKVEEGAFAPVKLQQGCLIVTVPGGRTQAHLVRNALIRWYKQRAYEKLNQKVEQLAPQVGAHPSQVEIKSFKARWGSCSSTGVVQFNWRIMLAPTQMVDYVVVHELCHLLQHNHSKAYWREVERVMPDYRACREWFKLNGSGLQV